MASDKVRVTLFRDGVELPFTLPEPWAEVTGTVRPMTAAEGARHDDRRKLRTPPERVELDAEVMAAHLKSWNLADENDVLYGIVAGNVGALQEDLLYALYAVVRGSVGSGVEVLGKFGGHSPSPPNTPAGSGAAASASA